jgi:hypothetical protein
MDAGAGSLRQAILDTPAGGTVDFQPGLTGTITLTTGELMIAKDLTIAGPGADAITVSGNQHSRVFEIGATFTVEISGLTIAQGSISVPATATGGGIRNSGALTLILCTVSGNVASSNGDDGEGGGIYNSGALTITDSTVSGNHVSGIFFGSGGGIYNAGTVMIMSSTISSNVALSSHQSGGGGISNGGTLTITSSTLSDNLSGSNGGGGISNGGTLTITSSTLSGNSAASGGGISNTSPGMLMVTGCTLSGNSASTGGGIYNLGAQAITASRNTILARNTAPGSPDMSGTLNSGGRNLIGDGTGGSGFDPTDLVGTASAPLDPKLGPLQDNGGPTLTRALLPGSPAIDAGDNTGAPMWDQRGPGFRRIVNGTIDIGAFEVQAHAASYPTRQPLPDPVPVQAVGIPGGPLLGQPPDLLAAPSPFSGPGIPDEQTGQPEPVTTATRQQARGTLVSTYPGTGQPAASLSSLSANDLDALALTMLGGP